MVAGFLNKLSSGQRISIHFIRRTLSEQRCSEVPPSPQPSVLNPQAVKDGKLICRIRIVVLSPFPPLSLPTNETNVLILPPSRRPHRKWASRDKPKEVAAVAAAAAHNPPSLPLSEKISQYSCKTDFLWTFCHKQSSPFPC